MSDSAEGPAEPKAEPERRLVWWVIFGLVCAWCTYLFFFGPRVRSRDLGPPSLEAPFPARQADYRWTLRTLDGEAVEFDQFRGRTVFLNVWATWCPPCVDELPSIDNLSTNPRLKDVAFLCVSVDDSAEAVEGFVKRRRMKVPVFLAVDPPPEPFFTEAIPATFVIAPDGRIVSEEVGAAQWDDPKAVEFLEKLLKLRPSGPRS